MKVVVVLANCQPSLNDFGSALQLTRSLIDRDDRKNDSVICQMLAITQTRSSILPIPESSISVRPTVTFAVTPG